MKPTVAHIAVVAILFVCLPLLIGADYMYWDDSHFPAIALTNIQTRDQVREASSSLAIFLNVNAEISADNTAAAQLTHAASGDNLVTEYMLTFDGDGVSTTGSTPTSYQSYDQFLTSPAAINYITDDNDVTVTLHVKASNSAGKLADAGTYTATQTLTVHWR